jgi:uncharacterized protein YmfQ (DUF2313 family)
MSDVLEQDEPQSVCGFTGDDYAEVLADLLPPGVVWPRDAETVLMRTMRGLAEEYARIHERDCDLLDESYPGSSTEAITDWERICGLPDECTGPLETLQERRAAVLSKLASRGGQSKQYYIDGAAILGFDITIREFRPFIAGQGRAGEPCYHQSRGRESPPFDPVPPGTLPDSTLSRNRDWWFVWEVTSLEAVKMFYFRAGESQAGDPLARWSNDMLECWILEHKPAHTWVIFRYPTPIP